MNRSIFVVFLPLLCAGAPQPSVPASDAAVVASLLVEAEHAAQGPRADRRMLGKALASLDRFGAHPLDTAGDPLPEWRSAALASAEPPLRGRTLGPAYRNGTLPPGGTVRLTQLFDGGRTARVAIATPGKAPLGFAVIDGEERAVCPPATGTERECSWVPLYSGRYEIVLSNGSDQQAGYYLVID